MCPSIHSLGMTSWDAAREHICLVALSLHWRWASLEASVSVWNSLALLGKLCAGCWLSGFTSNTVLRMVSRVNHLLMWAWSSLRESSSLVLLTWRNCFGDVTFLLPIVNFVCILHCRISFPCYFPFYLSSNSVPALIIPLPETEMKLQRELCSIRKQEIYLSICCVCVCVLCEWEGMYVPCVCVQRPGGSRGSFPYCSLPLPLRQGLSLNRFLD